jgi:hypothetical protein
MDYLQFKLLNIGTNLERRLDLILFSEKSHRRMRVFLGDRILDMNAFWNSFGESLGLGMEGKELRFLRKLTEVAMSVMNIKAAK